MIACKGWNTENYGAPLSDQDPYGADPSGTFLNRVHTYEVTARSTAPRRLVHFPKSCLHCEDAPCVTVCPTGASYKRVEDGIVLVNEDDCIGCGLCAWACPYGAREMDPAEGVMKKCTLCVDRIYNENLPEIDRDPGLRPHLPRRCAALRRSRRSRQRRQPTGRRTRRHRPDAGTGHQAGQQVPAARAPATPDIDVLGPLLEPVAEEPKGFLGWLDKALDRL